MLLNKIAFNEIRSVPDYTTYFYLQKELGFRSLQEVSNYINEVAEVKVSEDWMSPAFMEMSNYYCLGEFDE